MKRKNFFMAAAVATMSMAALAAVKSISSNDREFTALELANIEALTRGEVSVVGCKPMKGATCYVFDGNGQLVDKRKNQYPGNFKINVIV